jgi:hypothetical protein
MFREDQYGIGDLNSYAWSSLLTLNRVPTRLQLFAGLLVPRPATLAPFG